tara:strand:- start:485 stop:1396 length:912 start_codon:yes stop_codon:yes gene_type:complete
LSQPLPIIFNPECHPLGNLLCKALDAEPGNLEEHLFPDGESYLRIKTDVTDRLCLILMDLSHPNRKFLPLSFLCQTLREFEVGKIGLIAPYLSYMRQDRRFHAGEALTSKIFAKFISDQVDWLVTVDPHLHRYHSLDEVYTVPSRVVQGAPVLAEWLTTEEKLLLVGPDAESEQWVSRIAAQSGHPFVVGEKQRYGDRKVAITLPDLKEINFSTAVIIDDVISSGHTVLECVKALKERGVEEINCACVHGIFADEIDKVLLDSGIKQLVTTNTIVHCSNALDVSALLLPAIEEMIQAKVGEKI